MSQVRVKEIKKEIDDLFGDTSVPPKTTRDELEDIRDHIEGLLDTLMPNDD